MQIAHRNWRKGGLLAAIFCGLILGASGAAAQSRDRPYEIDPDMALPALGPDRLRVVTPTPRVRVTGGSEESSRSTRTIERRQSSGEEQAEPPAAQAVERARVSQTEPTPGTFRRAPGNEREPDEPIEYGRLIVFTQFESDVRVTIAGEPYPWGSTEGVLLYANEQYDVLFEQGGGEGSTPSQGRVVTVRLAPGETRVLMANVGEGGSPSARARPAPRRSSRDRSSRDEDEDEEIGYLGVSSSPRGTVYVDGENTGQMTPARRIPLDPGRHEVRIFYESEERFSETKNVLIRDGVNTNVFFRYRPDEDEE